MPMVFVLINVEIGGEEEVMKNLRQIEEVKEAYLLFGVYDIIVKVEAEDRQRVEEIIIWKIRKFDKVRQTITNWVHTGFDKREEQS
ncbi:Lrp/AsnC ligand binding domain-containing protein [Candidatus Bathyarchaeota archaeon]|nr:Lrp/AsnC ligand binding domain-containing protein [Candidatus Bathyarchaeota archaeon]